MGHALAYRCKAQAAASLGRAPVDRDIQGKPGGAALAAYLLDPRYISILYRTIRANLHLLIGCDPALPRPNQPWTVAARTPACASVSVRERSNQRTIQLPSREGMDSQIP